MNTDFQDRALLQLMQLCSPSLPIGGFSWSQGLEFAIDCGYVANEEQMGRWLTALLQSNLAQLDLPLLLRLYRARQQDDNEQLQHWNQLALASRETAELLLEDEQMGAALSKLLADVHGISIVSQVAAPLSYLTAFAVASVHLSIAERAMLSGFVWSWLENQIAAAIKTIPLGQTAGQRLFQNHLKTVESVLKAAYDVTDSALGMSMPGQVLASMFHEEQYCRLFRS